MKSQQKGKGGKVVGDFCRIHSTKIMETCLDTALRVSTYPRGLRRLLGIEEGKRARSR